MPNKPLCHPMTSHKITQGGEGGWKEKRNSIQSLVNAQVINGLVAHVELEHEIVKWTSSIANSLVLICNTVHNRCRGIYM